MPDRSTADGGTADGDTTDGDTAERDRLDIDVLFVGAGPASLAGATHLAQLLARHNRTASRPLEPTVAVLEKGKEVGAHALSGAVLDPRALRELFPADWQSAPLQAPVQRERLLFLTPKRAVRLPTPPPLRNHGCYVASLGSLVRWMAARVEAAGIDVFCEFPATELLFEGDAVIGVRTGDRGIDRQGAKKRNFEPGIDIRSRVVVLGEGPRGSLTKTLEQRLDLGAGRNPQVYAIGVKELWEVPAGRVAAGEVIHTMGWPLDRHTFGGGFLYGAANDQLVVGLVLGLDYRDPYLDPHRELQRFKTHPAIRRLIEGGTRALYGAKAIPEGGWWSMPRSFGDGFLVIGDSAGFLNSQRLKGIHLAMKSGMLAAETIFEALLADDFSHQSLASHPARVESSWAGLELRRVRNFHQAFDRGLGAGMLQAALGMVTGGRGWGIFDRLPTHPGHTRMGTIADHAAPPAMVADGHITFDRATNVYHSATSHDEDQPGHLLVRDPAVCVDECARLYANPCQRFCPAEVYEMVDDPKAPSGRRLQINASNCVHCKTCDIMDPYQIIDWVPPEGGGGPSYGRM